MWYNLILIAILLVFYFVLSILEKGGMPIEKSKKYMIWLSAILLILQSGLRNVAVGPDTYAYYLKFEESLSDTWMDVFSNFFTVYVEKEGKDAGYYLIQKLFTTFVPNFQSFLVFIASVFFIAFFTFVDKYTSTKLEVFLAVFVYLSLFYEFYSVTGCRQVLATAFCLFSIKYIRERKPIPFFLLMLIAFSIHRSSLVFVPFYFFSKLPRPGYVFIIALIFIPSLISISRQYAEQMAIWSGTDYYLMYSEEGGTGAKTFLLFYIAIASFLFVIQRSVIKEAPEDLLIYNGIYIALILLPLTYSSAALMRVVQYYSLFLTVGVSFFLRKKGFFSQSGMTMIFLAVSILALGYKIVRNTEEYCFFWQYMDLPINY